MMKRLALLSAFLLLLSLCFAAYLYMTCEVRVTGASAAAVEAALREDTFTQLSQQLALDAVIGTRFV